ncbi:MAG: hypothetical protein JWL83_2939 [Actinomycetia bacterium]|nr:hypothetical protein [Actinomycetes bacterium]
MAESVEEHSVTSASPKPTTIRRVDALIYVVASVLSLAAGIVLYRAMAPHLDIVKVELGGSGQPWPLPAGTRTAVRWDFALIAGYGLALLFAMRLAWAVFWSPRARTIAFGATCLAAAAVLADVAENILLLAANRPHQGILDWATAAAVVKFCCIVPAAIVGVAALLVTVLRLVNNRKSRLRDRVKLQTYPTFPLTADDPSVGDSSTEHPVPATDGEDRWRRGYLVPGFDEETLHLEPATAATIGICLSGGGVRSASVALGAMQTLRPQLEDARYLVSVSGGGYTAGALQLALTNARDPRWPKTGTPVQDPAEAFMPGSVEEDWVRRHADYLADSPSTMLVALGVVARVLVLSVVFLFGPAIVLGLAIGRLFKRLPLADWRPSALHPWSKHLAYPEVHRGTWLALGCLAALALLAYFVALWHRSRAHIWRRVAEGFTLVALVVAVIAVGLPSLAFGAAWVLSKAHSGRAAIGGSVGTLLLSYAVTLRSLVSKKKVKDTAGGGTSKRGNLVAAVPAGALQLVLVIVTLVALAGAWLLLFGGMIAIADQRDAVRTGLGCFAFLMVFGLFLDQTALSLHPFYRRQLARAFATRRVRRPDGRVVAEGYDFGEMTSLSRYAARLPRHGNVQTFPEVIFAGTANLTGEQRAPLNGVPYTFSADWVGGPDIGYVRTADLEQLPSNVKRDLTVEAAVAISGAAFASAMGRAGRWYGTLLAVTGVRLGSWLPNPVFVEEWNTATQRDKWTLPGIPRVRRLPYLVREVFGVHQFSDRLLQVTDGGHYENLGLVELLRRRCTEIYCIDASGDTPPTAGTLEQALTIAYSELGVTIELHDDVWDLVPGSAGPLDPSTVLTSLNARLSKQAVISATITYPPESGLPEDQREGVLIFAKTLLTPEMDYSVLSYAARNGIFPRDSTGDQFFDDGKFCAYRALGRELGTLANASAVEAYARRQEAEEAAEIVAVIIDAEW